jgi:3'(2'), 5'-bisphosphate nucleotidase
MPYETELQAALDAAELAGRGILEAYMRFQTIPDAPADISTEADRQSQEDILRFLHRHFPLDSLCAEEATPALALSGPGPRTWVVDPIDGSRGFAKKNGEFSVMIGLIAGGSAVVGVVLEPARRRCTYAVKGGGCHRRDGDAVAVPCHVSKVSDLAAATLVQSHTKDPNKPSRGMRALRPGRVVETYSAGLKLAMVARGEAEFYVNDYPAFHDWDVCAGQVLVEEAGGALSGLKGEAILYGQPKFRQTCQLLASNGVLHQAALARFAATP